jgi:phosphatidylinositol-4,5-bisphosphate 3-kinase
MCTREGHVFHIDFGHFLGNYKKKFGFKRERAPFVFTPQYANVLGGRKGKYFADFVELCGRAYNILRSQSDLFINLFQLMLCGGIPELRNARDIDHLRTALALGASEAQAAQMFTQLIYISLKTKTTVVNDMIHVWAHS